MAKKSTLFTALKKSIDAKKRLEKHDSAINKHEQEIERLKSLIIKDSLIAEATGANEMFSEFGFESVEIRLGALLYANEYIKASDDENRALDEFYTQEAINKKVNSLLEFSFGRLWPLLQQDTIGEVYVNEDGYVFVNDLTTGKQITDIYLSPSESKVLIEAVAGAVNEVINNDRPHLGCELYSLNARFQAQLPPLVRNPTFMIRKKASTIFSFEEYIQKGFITKEGADYLVNAVKEHKNILVTGGTGTGKTTFLNTLLKCVELYTPYDRTVILEDLSELQSNINDCLRMQTRVDADPNKSVTMQTLIWLSMRNSPNRIIVGEVRDGSAYDLLKGWNTGHPGGFGTTHANGALEGLDRLESLIYENPTAKGNFRQLLGQAVNIIVDIGRIDIPNGPSKRFIRDIIEVKGFNRHTESYDTSIIYHKEGSEP